MKRAPPGDMKKKLIHLVARVRAPKSPLSSREACQDLWQRLSRNFDAAACILMPNHLHLALEDSPRQAPRALASLLSAFRRRFHGLGFDWEPLPELREISDHRHLARTIRYIHLNPSRNALCRDPLEWEWSTHRDWIGAATNPWVDVARWARLMKWPVRTAPERMHAYVSADPAVQIAGTAFPAAAEGGRDERDFAVHEIVRAVSRATRSEGQSVPNFGPAGRRLAVLAARHWTHYRASQIARWLEISPSRVSRILGEGEPLTRTEIRALALLLADARLHK